jgi:hypothetical protein
MIDSLRDVVVGSALKTKVQLLVKSNDDDSLIGVDIDVAKKSYEGSFSSKVRAVNGVRVDCSSLAYFFRKSNDNRQLNKVYRVQDGFHVMIPYNQQTATGGADVLALLLKANGFSVWFDQFYEGELNEAAMMKAVEDSRCLVLFLTKEY